MLYNLFSSLNSLDIFKYISFRSCLAAFTAFFISIFFGHWFIKRLRTLKVGEDTTKTDSEELKRFIEPEVSISDRVIMWRLASQLITESPIIGNGIASFVLTARTGALPLQTPPNIYLYTVVEYGLIGFMLFLFWGFQIMRGFMEFHSSNKDKSADLISTGMTCGFTIVLLMAAFRNIGLVEPLFWGFLGLASAFLKVYTPEKNNDSNIISDAKAIHGG